MNSGAGDVGMDTEDQPVRDLSKYQEKVVSSDSSTYSALRVKLNSGSLPSSYFNVFNTVKADQLYISMHPLFHYKH